MQPKVIRIDGVIGTGEGEVSAQVVRDQLPSNGTDPIAVKIHSEGGSVFEGFAIHDTLAAYQGPKTLSVESSAFSIASYITTAFDEVEISPNGYMMLHNPYAQAEGDDEDLARQSQMLSQVKESMVKAYSNRSGKSEDEIKAILKSETYLNAQQSVDMGFATRISGQPVIGRAFARLSNMPHGVVSALFGAGSGGENREETEENSMSGSQPVAATLQEIKAAFPKAKAEFVLRCLEQSMPMASVASAAVEEMMAENEQLKAKIKAMEEEMAKAKAAMEDEEPAAEDEPGTEARAEEETEEETPVTARARGVRAVAKAKTTSGPSALVRWEKAIEDASQKCGGNKAKALKLANKANPGLREAMLAEVNA